MRAKKKFITTIIVPVYKAAETIERCARSLFEQTMTDGVEFLFVDDGSPDNSVSVLESVIMEYPNLVGSIRILHNEKNMGVSETRKRGIRESRGEYIAWVDSDDWVEPDMLESFWKASHNGEIDVVVQNVIIDHYQKGKLKSSNEWKLYSSETPKKALMNYHADKYVPWGLPFQMSRRNLIQEASQRVYNVNITEDAIMLIYIFANAKSCVWLEKPYYHYISKEGSSSLTSREYRTKEEWNLQMKNVNAVTEYLLLKDKESYAITANYIKWFWKNKFLPAFDNSWQFWKTYKECYRNAVLFDRTGIDTFAHKAKVWLKYNLYPIYWFKEGRYMFSKK